MTSKTTYPSPDSRTSLVDFSQALSETAASRMPAALTEALLPEITASFWLLVTSDALIDAKESQVLRMILDKALPSGVSMALELNWTPELWGLPAGAAPTPEILRRFRPLAEAAQLIRCSVEEAEAFFSSADPVAIQQHMAQRPALLITGPAGDLRWSIGGQKGRMDPGLVEDHDTFLARLLDKLCSHPQLLGSAGPGINAIADPDLLAEQLLSAAAPAAPSAGTHSPEPSTQGTGSVDGARSSERQD